MSDGPRGTAPAPRAPGGRAARWLAVALAAAAAAAVLMPLLGGGSTYELVMPPGSSGVADAALLEPVPHRRVGDVVWLELEPGDTLVLRNEDSVLHQVGGIVARPGETVLHTFSARGTFSGECSLDLTVFIEVADR